MKDKIGMRDYRIFEGIKYNIRSHLSNKTPGMYADIKDKETLIDGYTQLYIDTISEVYRKYDTEDERLHALMLSVVSSIALSEYILDSKE